MDCDRARRWRCQGRQHSRLGFALTLWVERRFEVHKGKLLQERKRGSSGLGREQGQCLGPGDGRAAGRRESVPVGEGREKDQSWALWRAGEKGKCSGEEPKAGRICHALYSDF